MSLCDYESYLIQPSSQISLAQIDANPGKDLPRAKEEAKEELYSIHQRLSDLQQRFFVDRRKKFLIVLQGMDTSGKNGTIRHVFRGVNPQGSPRGQL